MIKLKRAYDDPSDDDGTRILVERLWPRGLTKEKAAVDRWFKELAPSAALRKWYGHDPDRWPEFKKRYRKELDDADFEDMRELKSICRGGRVTFVFAARDEERNSAVVLRDYVQERMGTRN